MLGWQRNWCEDVTFFLTRSFIPVEGNAEKYRLKGRVKVTELKGLLGSYFTYTFVFVKG